MNTIEQRMVELAMQCYHGDYEETIKLAEASGIKTEWNGKLLRFKGKGEYPNYSNVPSAIHEGLDPNTIYVCLGFAFFGMFWTEVIGGGVKEVNRRWKAERKKKKK